MKIVLMLFLSLPVFSQELPTLKDVKTKANKIIDSNPVTECLSDSFDLINNPVLMSGKINGCVQTNLRPYMPLDELSKNNIQTVKDMEIKIEQKTNFLFSCFKSVNSLKELWNCLF